MTRIIQDLRIGTKLAITSALTILLVASMIYLQVTGGAAIGSASDKAAGQHAIAQSAAEAKASVRGMQVGIRDILLASNPAEIQKGAEYFADRRASALKFQGEMARLSKSAENRERISRLEVLIDGLRNGKDQLEGIRKQAIAKHAAAESSAELAKLADEVARIRKEVTLPINAEIEAVTSKIAEYAKKASEEAQHSAVNEVALVERSLPGIAASVALLVIGTCGVLHFTIARLMRAERPRWRKLAAAISRWSCRARSQGRGRRRRRGAVEKFKVVSEKKACTRSKPSIQQDQIAARQRKAGDDEAHDESEGAVGKFQ
jgi:hypothetical protein